MVRSFWNTHDGSRRMKEKGKLVMTNKQSHQFLNKLLGCVDGHVNTLNLNLTKVHKS